MNQELLTLLDKYMKARYLKQPTEKHFRNLSKAWSKRIKSKPVELREAA